VYCDPGEPESIEGCSKEQAEILRSRKRPRGETDEHRWKNMYHTLFPDIPDTEVPSPCNTSILFRSSLNTNKLTDHLVPHVDAKAVLEITNAFSQFFNDEFSKRFTDTYSYSNIIDVRGIVKRHMNDVIREYQEMEALSHATSQACPTGKRPILSSRKKRCTTALQAMRDEMTTTDGHRPLPTNQSHSLASHNQNLPQGDNLNDSAISNMYEFTNRPGSNSSFPSGSPVLQPPIGEEYHSINPSSPSHSTVPQNSQDNFQYVDLSDINSYDNGYGLTTAANFDQLRVFNQNYNPMSNNTSSVEAYPMLPMSNYTQSDALGYNDHNSSSMIDENPTRGSRGRKRNFSRVISLTDWAFIDNEASQSSHSSQHFQYSDQ